MKDAYLFCTVLLVIGLSFAPAWTPLAAADFEDGLVLYFPFESSDDAQTVDMSGQENHGEFVGAIRNDEGKFGKGIEFPTHLDGVLIPDTGSLLVKEAFTGSAWVYPTQWNFAGHGANRMLFVHTQINIDLLLAKGRMEIFSGGAWQQVGMGPEMPLEEWHMVTGTWSEEEGGKLYRDGSVVKHVKGIKTIDHNVGPSYLGFMKPLDLGLEGYVGRMDEVRVYNRELSEEEVDELFRFEPQAKAVAPKDKLAIMWGTIKFSR